MFFYCLLLLSFFWDGMRIILLRSPMLRLNASNATLTHFLSAKIHAYALIKGRILFNNVKTIRLSLIPQDPSRP